MTDPVLPPRPPAAPLRLINAACVLALIGMGFSLAHLLWPTALLFALFMLVGQGSFALATLLYAVAIFSDLKRQKVL